MEINAARSQRHYYVLRLTTMIGGVIVPALVSFNLDGTQWLTLVIIAIRLLVAVSAAIAEFFHFCDRWGHYRRTAEHLKIEGWHYFQLAGLYQGMNYAEA